MRATWSTGFNADDRLSDPGERAIADIDAAIPELRTALAWLIDHDEPELAGCLVAALVHYGMLRLRPDVLAWSVQVTARPRRPQSGSIAGLGNGGVRGMDGRRYRRSPAAQRAGTAARRAPGPPLPPKVPTICGTVALINGRLDDAIQWYRRAVEAAVAVRRTGCCAAATELLPLGYAGDPTAAERAEQLLHDIGDIETARSAYVWYCAGEAVLATHIDLARTRLSRAIELAERTGAAFVTGVAERRRRPSTPSSETRPPPPTTTDGCSITGAVPGSGPPNGRCSARSPVCSTDSACVATLRCCWGPYEPRPPATVSSGPMKSRWRSSANGSALP